jgi:hypothetical protein
VTKRVTPLIDTSYSNQQSKNPVNNKAYFYRVFGVTLEKKEYCMSARWLPSELDKLLVDKEPLELGRMEVDEFFEELIRMIRLRDRQTDREN